METTTAFILIVIGLMAGVFGGIFGSKIALILPEQLMKKIFAVFLILVALKMFFSKHAGVFAVNAYLAGNIIDNQQTCTAHESCDKH